MNDRLALFPESTGRISTPTGTSLAIAGCDLAGLADRFGTPLYVYDQASLDAAVDQYRQALADFYPGPAAITYAGKAFLCLALAQWVRQQDLWLDCTGAGELSIAAAAGLPRARTLVHGVNKSPRDLAAALAQAGTLVVDNLDELERLIAQLPGDGQPVPDLWLRYRPGLTVDSHSYVQTGQADSKFGLAAAEIGVAVRLMRANGLPVAGLHFHLGSLVRDPAPLLEALAKSLDLLVEHDLGAGISLSPGGGLGVPYHEADLPGPDIREYVRLIADQVVSGCRARALPLPTLQLEPGRSLVARAGVALYRVGAVKRSATRRWLLLDGGLADNPRPALYGARYSALPVREPERPPVGPAWLAGPYCESGDVLIQDLPLPEIEPGELVAVPVSGAYQLSMASNYNGASRPAVAWLANGRADLIQTREEPADLLRRDQPLPE